MDIHFKERRNIIFPLLLAAMVILAACGGDEDSPLDTGQTYQQDVTLNAQGTQQTVTLTDLKSKIDDVTNSTDWLTVLISNCQEWRKGASQCNAGVCRRAENRH